MYFAYTDAASSPRNVTIEDIAATSVNISWYNPVNLGTPLFTVFSLILSSGDISDRVVNITATNNTDSDFINRLTISSLNPNTQYTVIIRAVMLHQMLGSIVSSNSIPVLFNTTSSSELVLVKLNYYFLMIFRP